MNGQWIKSTNWDNEGNSFAILLMIKDNRATVFQENGKVWETGSIQ